MGRRGWTREVIRPNCRATLPRPKTCVSVDGELSREFDVSNDVWQGVLFNLQSGVLIRPLKSVVVFVQIPLTQNDQLSPDCENEESGFLLHTKNKWWNIHRNIFSIEISKSIPAKNEWIGNVCVYVYQSLVIGVIRFGNTTRTSSCCWWLDMSMLSLEMWLPPCCSCSSLE